MKIFKRLTAVILTLTIGFSVCVPSAGAVKTEPENFDEYREIFEDGGYPALSTAQFIEIVNMFNTVYRFLTGRGFIEQEHFNFVMDEMLMEICKGVADKSGFDVALVGSNLPDVNQLAEFVTGVFRIDPVVLRERFFELQREQDAQGNWSMAGFYYFLGIYFSVIEECKAYCVPLEEEN